MPYSILAAQAAAVRDTLIARLDGVRTAALQPRGDGQPRRRASPPIVALVAVGLALGAAGFAEGGKRAATQTADKVTLTRLAAEERVGQRYMISSADPRAVRVGATVLEEGGSAVDAAIAIQAVLSLVEPHSSGPGGGAFMMHYDAETGLTRLYEGRETAPMAAGPDHLMGADGERMGWYEARTGGHSVATPGLMRMLERAHLDHGRLPWSRLFDEAVTMSFQGFVVSARVAKFMEGGSPDRLAEASHGADYFMPDGEPWQPGDIITNPDLAETFRIIAEQGADAFYTGPIAEDIVAAVQGSGGKPGVLSLADMRDYTMRVREPLCFDYRDHEICSAGPPASGALALGQLLGMLEHFDMSATAPDSVEGWHLFLEASKLAFADRAQYVADDSFVSVPTAGLLDPTYLMLRAQHIDRDSAMATPVPAGNPPWREAEARAPDTSPDSHGTSHIVVVDEAGDIVSMTTSIESGWGSYVFARGFLLNNTMTDFSFEPEADGRPVANAVAPGKRPRSTMTPMIVFGPDGEPRLAIGSPGGGRMVHFIGKVLVGMIDWGLTAKQAIELPNLTNMNGETDIEEFTWAESLAGPLGERGHEVDIRDLASGLQAVHFTDRGLVGVADSRREGVALGE
ncbi:MAG: gamma-glutamyltransferase [Azospirillaceae bacterium]